MTDLRERLRAGELTCSVEEACPILGVGRGLGYELARRGELPGCLRLGNRYRVSIPALLSALGVDSLEETP